MGLNNLNVGELVLMKLKVNSECISIVQILLPKIMFLINVE